MKNAPKISQPREKWRMDYVNICCCILAFVLYLNTLKAGFVYDDRRAILNNPDVTGATQPWYQLLFNDFWGTPLVDSGSHGSYRPMCVLSYKLNHIVGGLKPFGYHLINVLLHCLSTGLVVKLARYILPNGISIIISGLLFASHPIHTEAVAGIVGRADLIACNFYILTILSYIKHVQWRKKCYLRHWMALCGAILSASAAVLCKETAVSALVICIIYDILKGFNIIFKDKHQLRSIGIVAVVTLTIMHLRLSLPGPTKQFSIADNPTARVNSLMTRFYTFLYLPVFNFIMLLYPQTLSFDWGMDAIPRITSFFDSRNFISIAFYAGLCVVIMKCVVRLRKKPSISMSSHKNRKIVRMKRKHQVINKNNNDNKNSEILIDNKNDSNNNNNINNNNNEYNNEYKNNNNNENLMDNNNNNNNENLMDNNNNNNNCENNITWPLSKHNQLLSTETGCSACKNNNSNYHQMSANQTNYNDYNYSMIIPSYDTSHVMNGLEQSEINKYNLNQSISLSPLKKYIRNNNNLVYLMNKDDNNNNNNEFINDNNNNNLYVIDNNNYTSPKSSTLMSKSSKLSALYMTIKAYPINRQKLIDGVKNLSCRISKAAIHNLNNFTNEETNSKLSSSAAILISLTILILPFIPATNVFFYVGFVVAERILYLPSVGYCLLVGLGLGKLINSQKKLEHNVRMRYKSDKRSNAKSIAIVLCIIVMLSAFSFKTMIRNRDWYDEKSLYRSAVNVNPPKALGNLGSIFCSLGRYLEAEKVLKAALKHRPNMADVHYNLGILYQNQLKYENAVQSFQKAIHFRPTLALAYLNLGTSLIALGRCNEAALVLRDGTKLDSSGLRDKTEHENARISSLIQLGGLYTEQGKLQRALAVYREALHTLPSSYPPQEIYHRLGDVFLRLNKWPEAERFHQAALEAEPNHIGAHISYGTILARNSSRSLDAEQYFKRAIRLAPLDSSIHHHYAEFLASIGRHEEACKSRVKAAELSPNNYNLVMAAATSLRWRDRKEDALKWYRQAVNLRPKDALVHSNLGAIFHILGHTELAIQSYKTALNLQPNDATTLNNLKKLKVIEFS
ncbi:unnamed protein product [Chironomus riparius]|uniref:dolichyl-phosphate-mannose--protein mannosyltransferase n=1 Tax=Chironomus riparius TaxID=315576 RepID=A0A9N9WRQ9_9DIPT|nr:unnamed protein product [Chironomus riparius]